MLQFLRAPAPHWWRAPLLRPKVRRAISFTPLLRRNLAYPKEGVFQQQQPPAHLNTPHSTSGYPTGGVFSPQQSQEYPNVAHPPQFPLRSAQHPTYPPAYPSQSSTPPPRRRWRFVPHWTMVLSVIMFTGCGIWLGQQTLNSLIIAIPGSDEDREELAYLSEEFDELILVKQLRNSWRLVDGQSKPVYREWTAYEALKGPATRAEHLSTGPLAGSAGIAAQRIFWDEESGILLCFINFGQATTGWLNVVHGGALATVADETLCRFASRKTNSSACMTAHLEMKYLDTVHPGQWFVFITSMDRAQVSTERKVYVHGALACCSVAAPSLQGQELIDVHVHTEAKALIVVPKHTAAQSIPEDF